MYVPLPDTLMQTKQQANRTILELLWRSFYLISVLILFYIFVSYIVVTINPTTLFIDEQLFNSSYIRILLGIGLLLGFNGWFILKLLKRINYRSPWHMERSEKILTLSSAVILGYIYGGSLPLPSVISFLIFAGLTIGFVYMIPQLPSFYSYYKMSDLKYFLTIPLTKIIRTSLNRYIYHIQTTEDEKQEAFVITKKQIRIFLFICVSLVLIIVVGIIMMMIAFKYLTGKAYQENLLRQKFIITSIEPQQIIPAANVVIKGYNFGLRVDKTYKLMSESGSITEIVSWENERIEFVVPLYMPLGKNHIWIVRSVDELDLRKGITKSNKLPVYAYSRFAILPDADDTKQERIIKKIRKYLYFHVPALHPYLFVSYE